MYGDFLGHLTGVLGTPELIALSAIGAILGIVLGCLPGISSTMSLAILLPVTYAMAPEAAIVFLIGVFSASVYGGSISAILLNIPGTPGAIVTQLDGYPMARSGRAGEALTIALFSSTLGGIVGLLVLMLIAPLIVAGAMQFRSPEFAAATVFGLTMLAYASPGSTFKGLMAGLVGLVCGMVGFDTVTDTPRFTFGTTLLESGIDLVPLTVGIFGLAEVMRTIELGSAKTAAVERIGRLIPPWRSLLGLWGSIGRGSILGAVVGAIPAAGSAIAVAVSYTQEQRLSRHPERFGKGAPEGIAAPEASNNACVGGALVPMMTLGIPGDSMTAILMASLLIHGLRPGPMLFADRPDFVAAVYVALFLALIFTLIFGLVFIRQIVRLLQLPPNILLVIVTLLCFVGAFAIRNNVDDVIVMVAFGVIGFIMTRLKIPIAPLAFGLILGPILEENLRRALIVSDGSWLVFVERPISATLLAISLLAVLYPMISPSLRKGLKVGRAKRLNDVE
ncbi:tripartite tricarboxylate transporter permease [Acuticoccus sp. M5D2P5]|uniref:tripartite tricarboxylate transporter permease n=1 Tax=Acuticoccus kalidii TaxID=2910977 RepID=UPI001F1C661B|nr:tripartite tricarboxylate transporter permease [Acuticoccus kalidii]MCF3935381.1 tripartite tricarboxylate transporter permease [Acuticoccus kalidii]